MSTPTTLKQIEQSKKRMEARKKAATNAGAGDYYGYQPLSWSTRSGGYGFGQQYGSYNRPHSNRGTSTHIDFTDDLAVGRQYTSFEHKKSSKQSGGARPFVPKEKAVIKVEEAPDSVECDEVVIDDEKLVCFNGRQHWLSNLYASPMTIEGHEYPSVEHYYQACKLYTLGDARLAMQIRRIPDAGNVKVAAKRLLREVVSNEQVDHWKNTKGPIILKHAIVHKFVQNPQLREKLIATGDSLLAHTYDKDRVFATGCTKEKLTEWAKQNAGKTIKIPKNISNETMVYVPLMGEGKNVLGVIGMQVREQVRHMQSTTREVDDPILAAAMANLNLYSAAADKKTNDVTTPDGIDGDDNSPSNKDDDAANTSPSKTTKSKKST